jgi:hypothetical protein
MFGSIRILVFSKGSEDLYAYIAKMSCRIISYDLMLGVHVYLYSLKIQKTCIPVKS